jgi:hypothetical protein
MPSGPSCSGTGRLHEGDNDNGVRMRCGIIKSEIKKYRAGFQPDVINRAEIQPDVTMIV